MSEMIERVAKAIHGNSRSGYENSLEVVKDADRRAARDAITAMREPSQEMIEECCDAYGDPIWDGKTFWRVMINIALGEEKLL